MNLLRVRFIFGLYVKGVFDVFDRLFFLGG